MKILLTLFLMLPALAVADDFTGTFVLDSKTVTGTLKVKRFEDNSITFKLDAKDDHASCSVHDSLQLKRRTATFLDESALCKITLDFGINQVSVSTKNCARFCSGESVRMNGSYKKTSNESL